MRILELLLSLMAIIFALAFYLPEFPTLWKDKNLTHHPGAGCPGPGYPGGIPLAALALIHCSC